MRAQYLNASKERKGGTAKKTKAKEGGGKDLNAQGGQLFIWAPLELELAIRGGSIASRLSITIILYGNIYG
jgi:hypothetical protein